MPLKLDQSTNPSALPPLPLAFDPTAQAFAGTNLQQAEPNQLPYSQVPQEDPSLVNAPENLNDNVIQISMSFDEGSSAKGAQGQQGRGHTNSKKTGKKNIMDLKKLSGQGSIDQLLNQNAQFTKSALSDYPAKNLGLGAGGFKDPYPRSSKRSAKGVSRARGQKSTSSRQSKPEQLVVPDHFIAIPKDES